MTDLTHDEMRTFCERYKDISIEVRGVKIPLSPFARGCLSLLDEVSQLGATVEHMDAICHTRDSRIKELEGENERLRDLLGKLYDKWECGVSCQELSDDGDVMGIYLGNAVKLNKQEEDEYLEALSHKDTEKRV